MRAFTLLIPFSFFIVIYPAWSFTLNNTVAATFPANDVPVNVAAHTCNNLGISNQDLLEMVADAVNNYWNKAPNSRLRLRKGSLTSVSAAFQTEPGCSSTSGGSCTPNPNLVVSSGILISCNTDTGSPANFTSGVMAVTIPNNIQGRNINGSLILLNDKADNSFKNKSHDEQVAILAHEIGHAVGLGHSPVEDSLMYYASIPTRRSLGWDDLDGLAYLYPAGQPFTGCGSITLNHDDHASNGPGIFMVTMLLGLGLILAMKSCLKTPKSLR
ncbi:MAG: matrixin family metalloprotease [Bdellovibrio sp.]|nr:matrixin family metalloprotease [Bdellovibrio sp.]